MQVEFGLCRSDDIKIALCDLGRTRGAFVCRARVGFPCAGLKKDLACGIEPLISGSKLAGLAQAIAYETEDITERATAQTAYITRLG